MLVNVVIEAPTILREQHFLFYYILSDTDKHKDIAYTNSSLREKLGAVILKKGRCD